MYKNHGEETRIDVNGDVRVDSRDHLGVVGLALGILIPIKVEPPEFIPSTGRSTRPKVSRASIQ